MPLGRANSKHISANAMRCDAKVAVGPEAPRDYDDEGRQSFRSASAFAFASMSTSTLATTSVLSSMSSTILPAAGVLNAGGDGGGGGGAALEDAAGTCDDEGRGPTTQARWRGSSQPPAGKSQSRMYAHQYPYRAAMKYLAWTPSLDDQFIFSTDGSGRALGGGGA